MVKVSPSFTWLGSILLISACGSGSGSPQDGGPEDGGEQLLGAIGTTCTETEGCEGRNCLMWLEGGYCSVVGCGLDNPCPSGSVCVPVRENVDEEQNVCLKLCDMVDDCRAEDGYTCDDDATCWPGPDVQDLQPVGGPCRLNTECASGRCMFEYYGDRPTGNTGGFCSYWDCFNTGCPPGSDCVSVSGGAVCFATCTADEDCRGGYYCDPQRNACLPGCQSNASCPDKHVCLDGWCVETWRACGVTNLAGWCPAGQWCDAGACTSDPFSCDQDSALEPNDSLAEAAALDWGRTIGFRVCDGDEDWYEVQVPASLMTEVKILFDDHAGNLDLLAYSESGDFVRSLWREYPYVGDLISDFDISNETITFYPAQSDRTYFLRVLGSEGATNTYGLSVRHFPYEDGVMCQDVYDQDECEGRPDGVLRFYQFPLADPDDPYGGDNYDFATVGSYLWARRETIEIVREAIRATNERYPHIGTVYLVDASQEDGLTPGHDMAALRHCETCHDQGGNIDITYYQTGSDNWTRRVCGPGGSNVTPDGLQCTAAAASGHIVDVDPQVYLMAKLLEHPRTRAIGVDPVLATVLQSRASQMLSTGDISNEGYNGFFTQLGLWATHHDHIHLSLQWWE